MNYKHARSVNVTSYSGDYTLPILEKEKDLSFDDLAGRVK